MEVGSVAQLLSVDQAIAILDGIALRPRVVELGLMEAIDHRLAEDIFADRDYPPFDKAVMDGYAIHAADAVEAGARLAVVETIAAGEFGAFAVRSGEASKIMTGAPMPAGADAVIPIEHTSRDGQDVLLDRAVKSGNAIARRGSDSPADRLLVPRGSVIGPVQVGVAASVGKAQVKVFDRPSVGVLTTGNEVVPMHQSPVGAQIRNSNGPMIGSLLQQIGCKVVDLGIVCDDREELKQAIQDGMRLDALVLTGGMSMGERDYVPVLLREIGFDLKISKLRIKPGKPFVFAMNSSMARPANPRLVFGLPGNPLSAFVCAIRLASRVLLRLGGLPLEALRRELPLRAISIDLPANGPRELYLPAFEEGESVHPLSPAGSADLFTLSRANCLIVRPENDTARRAGDTVRVLNLTNK